ncbi:MAG: hypothetical protein JXL82_02480 [Candidatus Omnitrophica bacterium]|nr:hypothetical protein [Candidatus Omnitrophota bacterium]
MRKRACFSSAAVFCFMFLAASLCWAGNSWENIGREMRNARTVVVDPDDVKNIYLGTDRGLFKSENSGESWRNLFLSKTKSIGINFLLFDPADKNIIYAATDSGLFCSSNKGLKWDRIFKGKNNFEVDCLAAAVLRGVIYLGTKQGLFVSRDKGRSWHKEQGKLEVAQIFHIVSFSEELKLLYLACSDGVFKSIDSGESWERVFVSTPKDNGGEEGNGEEDQDEETKYSDIRYMAVDPNNPKFLFLATSRGIYQSKDEGISWSAFSEYGLLNRDISFLLCSKEAQLYSVSKSGIFAYKAPAWEELSFGFSFKKVNFIALDKNNTFYACLDSGLFRLVSEVSFKGSEILTGYFNNEPTISEVQREAIKYAEVSPDKISRWRKQAAKRAWLPSLKLNFGRDTTDLWHWESGSSAIGQSGDDLLRRGKDALDWDVSVSWDLSELIWSTDQTSIDVRSRLMVQLRDDILDEVNKLYFERIRVKMELDNLSIEDRKKRFEKELRLRELTASIDALTGGYFSQYLIKSN